MKQHLSKLAALSLGFVAFFSLAGAAHAQTSGAVTTIGTMPDGLQFYVDGTQYQHAISVDWPVGSKHTLVVTDIQSLPQYATGSQLSFNNWSWSGGSFQGTTLIITVDPSIKQYVANFAVQYLLTVNFFPCTTPPCNNGPGTVSINGTTYNTSQQIWVPAGSTAILQAFPNPGYVFGGWLPGTGQVIQGFQDSVTVNYPMQAYPQFQVARQINFATLPAGLQVLADHTVFNTPGSLDWGWGSTHSLGALSPQYDLQGNPWIFSSWSDGGAQNHAYTVAQTIAPDTLIATFAQGVYTTFVTSPPLLSLTIDGRSNWLSYDFAWGVGETHTFSAPAQQTDAQGHVWAFSGWSNNGPAAQSVTIPQSAVSTGLRFIATYTPMGHLTVTSALAGLTVTVNGNACATPCDVYQAPGTQVDVSAPASVPVGSASRQDFTGWSSGANGTGDLILTMSTTPVQVSANYHLLNYLSSSSNPAGGVSWVYSPASPDGYYDSQATVNIAVTPLPGFRFQNWAGDLSGPVPTGTLAMSTPRTVQAVLAKVPYLPATAVNNGAGSTPQTGVAPGSVISIFGVNLAAAPVVGPGNPMVQTLGGLTARIGNRLLPLFFVSPSQINAQLPDDVSQGTATLTVSSTGQPDVQASFTVVQDAPGVFAQVVDSQSFAVAFHADGSLISTASPAQAGEVITVYGTGFGPSSPARPEGLPVSAAPPLVLQDPASVQVGSASFAAQSASAVPGSVGLDAVQFVLGDGVPTGTNAALTVTVNGQASNTVLLPLQ